MSKMNRSNSRSKTIHHIAIVAIFIGLVVFQGCGPCGCNDGNKVVCFRVIEEDQAKAVAIKNNKLPYMQIPNFEANILEGNSFWKIKGKSFRYYDYALGISPTELRKKVEQAQLLFLWNRLKNFPERCIGETKDHVGIAYRQSDSSWGGWNNSKTPLELVAGIEKLSEKYPAPLGQKLRKDRNFSYYLGIWRQNAYQRMAYDCLLILRTKEKAKELRYPESKELVTKLRRHLKDAHMTLNSIDSDEKEIKGLSREIPPSKQVGANEAEQK